MYLEQRQQVLLQLHLHSGLNTGLQWIGQRQLEDETRNIKISGFGATYIRDFTVLLMIQYMGCNIYYEGKMT